MNISEQQPVELHQDLKEADKKYLEWVQRKHGQQSKEFVDKLILACSEAFVAKRKEQDGELSQSDRAATYSKIRIPLQQDYDKILRHNASIRICS